MTDTTADWEIEVGSFDIACPVCQTPVPVVVSCRTENNENAWLGQATMECTPDMTELWAHLWTHNEDDDD